MTSPFKRLFILIALLTFSSNIIASHVGGGYISYKYTGNANEYIIELHRISPCDGSNPIGNSLSLCYSSLTAGINGQLILNNIVIDTLLYTTCNGSLGACSNGDPILNVSYSAVILLPVQASDWTFSFADCCMGVVNNISLQGPGIYIYATLDNLNTPGNSSPQFNDSIYYENCIGVLSMMNYNGYDIDGDSLVYNLIPAYESTISCPDTPIILNYSSTFSASNPISSFTPVTFNSTSGVLGFTPSQLEFDLVCIHVQEYRNGTLISTITREDIINTYAGFQNPNMIKGKIFYDLNTNGAQDPNEYGISGLNVMSSPFGLYTTTDVNGDYTLEAYFGSYALSIANMPKYCHTVPSVNYASFSMPGQIDSLNDFAMAPDSNVVDFSLIGNYIHNLRPCDTSSFCLSVLNSGTDTSSTVLVTSIPSIFTILNINPPADSTSGNFLLWNTPAMWPGATNQYCISIAVNCNTPITTPFCIPASLSTAQLDVYPQDDTILSCSQIVGSCDPNLKAVNEKIISPSFVADQDWIYYTIYFQNTGTAPALIVNIKDAIDPGLEAGSLELISYSHPCLFKMSSTGLVDFTFNNINLPDSLTNEPASHGFVEYRIKPKTNLQTGATILNAASIYFDTNAPIVTNTVQTLVSNLTSTLAISSHKVKCLMYPNPFSDIINIHITQGDIVVFEMMDMMGHIQLKKQLNQYSIFNTSTWDRGIYFYRAYDRRGNISTGKLIKQ